jgi:ankyrin repeat protein
MQQWGQTALYNAASRGMIKVVEKLCKAGANVNIKTTVRFPGFLFKLY